MSLNYAKRFGRRIAQRDGWKCHYCGIALVPVDAPHDDMRYYYPHGTRIPSQGNVACPVRPGYAQTTVDHVIARIKGGTDDLDNLVLACHSCNGRKRATSAAEFTGEAYG